MAPTFPLALICIFLSGLGVAAFHPDGSKSANHVSGERKSSAMLPHYQRASLVSKEQTGLKAEARAQKTVWGPLTTLVALIAVRSWVHLGLATFIPLYVVDVLHQSKDQGASLLGIFLIAGAVGTLLGGQLADRFGAYKVVFMSMILTGAILVSTFSPTIVLGQ